MYEKWLWEGDNCLKGFLMRLTFEGSMRMNDFEDSTLEEILGWQINEWLDLRIDPFIKYDYETKNIENIHNILII